MSTPSFNAMQTVKRRFFAMRNGIIADTLRRAGSPFRFIFGLNLPQIIEIATEIGISSALAEELWQNRSTRESMLLAPLIVDKESFTQEDAERWIASIPAAEVADILCHKLLRHQDYAWELSEKLIHEKVTISSKKNRVAWTQYTAIRLAFNLVGQNPDRALAIAQAPDIQVDLYPFAQSLVMEAKFVLES